MSTNVPLSKQVTWLSPTLKDLVGGTAKEGDVGKGEVLLEIMQSNTITMIASHKKNTNIKMGSVLCACLSCCMLNLISRGDVFSY